MTSVLLDPGLVVPDRNRDAAEVAQFWNRFMSWVLDGRAIVGERTHGALLESMGMVHDPAVLPMPLRRDVHRALNKLLAREPLRHSTLGSASVFDVAYVGPTYHQQLLMDDVVGAGNADNLVLGSHSDFWSSAASAVKCLPPPPAELILHLGPGLPTEDEEVLRRATWFTGKRILIVGGQVDLRLKDSLVAELGINVKDFRWIESERHKKASNLPAIVRGCDSDHIVICITGKVGHDVSGILQSECDKRGISYRYVEYASELRAFLHQVCDRAASAEDVAVTAS